MNNITPPAPDNGTPIAVYKPRWSAFEIVSLILVLAIPVVINLTIAESPSAWALVGFGIAGAGLLVFVGHSRKKDATAELRETPDGTWVLKEGNGNHTGHEQHINPTHVTSLSLPPDNDTRPGYLLSVTDESGEQTARMRLPKKLATQSLPVTTALVGINTRVNTGRKYQQIAAALDIRNT